MAAAKPSWHEVWDLLPQIFPGREDEPVPVDATDRLIMRFAVPLLQDRPDATVVILDDRFGALTLAVTTLVTAGSVRVHQDALSAEHRLDRAATATALTGFQSYPKLTPEIFTDAELVLWVLPRSIAAIQDTAEVIAAHAPATVHVLAGGRVKYLTAAMTTTLESLFAEVQPSLALGKSRVLHLEHPRPADRTFPRTAATDIGPVAAYGAVFAGASVDLGTRALVQALTGPSAALLPPAQQVTQVMDLGCGTGLLATWAASSWPHAQVWATDHSAAAVASAMLTAAAHGVSDRVRGHRADVGAGIPPASMDVILCNPPFHDGPAVRTNTALGMFAQAQALLRPGGQLWCVWNSPLRYRPALERLVGPTIQVARNHRFTVTMSVRD